MSNDTIEVTAMAHANLGASSAHRWMKCPGSVRLSKDMPDTSSRYAREGTAAHELAAMCLETGQDAASFLGEEILVEPDTFEVDREMARAVQKYLDYCRALMTTGEYKVENRFSLEKLDPPAPMFGTADFTHWDPEASLLDVTDYKHGQGVAVDARKNPQLLYYALGAVLDYHVRPDKIRVTIVQPRAEHAEGPIRSWTFSWQTLLQFKELVMEAAERAARPDAPVGPVGDHCKFCPAMAVCPAQKENAQLVAQGEFETIPEAGPPEPESLSDEQLQQVLMAGPMLEDFLSEVRSYVQKRLESGDQLEGFKLVEKRGRRKWKDEEEFIEWADKHGIDPYYRKIRSPYKAEQAAKQQDEEIEVPGDLWEKKSSGLKLVSADHPKPAMLPADAAAEEFEPVEEQTTPDEEEGTDDVRATGAARELAEEHGINLSEVDGTGQKGRVLKGDVAALIE